MTYKAINVLLVAFLVRLVCQTVVASASDPPADDNAGGAAIHVFSPVIEGHGVGGLALDQIGNLYVADFGETVFKFTPEGKASEFASGLYGASGNAVDPHGNLLQSNFYRNTITEFDRFGHAKELITTNLNGPVGIAIDDRSGNIFVANCRGNSIVRIEPDAPASELKCANLR